jgi:hypothetical protein
MWITRVSINNPVFATMVMVALCVLGLFAYQQAGRRADARGAPCPAPGSTCATPAPAPRPWSARSPSRSKRPINSIAGVKRITSRSFEGRMQASVEFSLDADMGPCDAGGARPCVAVQAASRGTSRRRSSRAWNNDNSQPVVNFALISATRSAARAVDLAEQVVGKRLQRVEGVARCRDLRPDHARGAHRPRPACACAPTASRRRDGCGAARGQCRSAGRAAGQRPVQDRCCASKGGARPARSSPAVVVARRNGLPLTAGRPRRAVEREREPDTLAASTASRASTSTSSSSRTPTSSTGDGREGGHRRAAQEPAARCRTALIWTATSSRVA